MSKELGSAIGAKLGEILDDTLAKANAQGDANGMGGVVDSILDRLDGDNDDPAKRMQVIGANVGAKIGEMFGLGDPNTSDEPEQTAQNQSGSLSDAIGNLLGGGANAAQGGSSGNILGDIAGSMIKNIADKNGDGKVDMGEIAQTLMESFGKKA